MKKIYSILAGLLLTASLIFTQQTTAQAPQKMSYQSVIRNSSNVLLAGTQVGIRISVLQGSETGPAVYVETQTATTNGNGLLSIKIGTGTATTGTFAGINWAAGTYFIKTETDPAGGTNYTITGTQEILSVPYAMYAAKSGDATTMGAIGGSSTANGGTITAGVLSLTPADGSNGGIVTNGIQIIGGAKTFAAAPALSTATASQALFTDANKNVISNAITGTGNVVLSTSPTLIGTITAANQTLSGTLGVGTTTPNASAKLEVSSSTQGFLPPRMTEAQRNAITNPATGLVVFCTNCAQPSVVGELQVYAGGMWRNMMGSAAGVPINIGDSHGGGKVAYILQNGDPGYVAGEVHGLIAAPSDQIAVIRWNNGSNVTTNATGTAIGTGSTNTNTIVSVQGEGIYAAKLCSDLILNGYTDWYLPSLNELNKLYINKVLVGGFVNPFYFSSTEWNIGDAFFQNFNNGDQSVDPKSSGNAVRAVRAF
jgi:hypothetical protein